MFSGIIENLGKVEYIEENEGKVFTIHHELKPQHNADQIKIGDSISINGVCTTVTKLGNDNLEKNCFTCFASKETLALTNLQFLQVNDYVNLERSLVYQGRIDGHLVYGHVDQCVELIEVVQGKSSIFEFALPNVVGLEYIVPKGSIAINGVSLTVYEKLAESIKVMIIPHTIKATNFHLLQKGNLVNIEFDMMSKYLKNFFEQNLNH